MASGVVLISLGLEADKAWRLGQRDWEDSTFAGCATGTLAFRLLMACICTYVHTTCCFSCPMDIDFDLKISQANEASAGQVKESAKPCPCPCISKTLR